MRIKSQMPKRNVPREKGRRIEKLAELTGIACESSNKTDEKGSEKSTSATANTTKR